MNSCKGEARARGAVISWEGRKEKRNIGCVAGLPLPVCGSALRSAVLPLYLDSWSSPSDMHAEWVASVFFL